MVDRLAPGEARLDLPGQQRHLAAGHVQAPPRLHEALVGLGLRHPGRVGELPQGAGRAPLAAVADPGGPVRATAPLPLVVPAPPLAAHPRAGGALPRAVGVAYPAPPTGLAVSAVVPERAVGVPRPCRAVAPELAGDARGVDAEPLRDPGEAPSPDDPVLDPPAHLEGEVGVVLCCRHVSHRLPGRRAEQWFQRTANRARGGRGRRGRVSARGARPLRQTYCSPSCTSFGNQEIFSPAFCGLCATGATPPARFQTRWRPRCSRTGRWHAAPRQTCRSA